MSLRHLLKVSYCACVIFVGILPQHVEADDNEYWVASLNRAEKIYGILLHTAPTMEDLDKGEQLRTDIVQHLKNSSTFAEIVRKSLRYDGRSWVRGLCAATLIKAFGKEDVADYIFMLSDPDQDVRSFGILAIRAYKLQEAACSLASGLTSTNAVERYSALRGVADLQGWKGLPFYSTYLYDSDENMSLEAAKAFRSCKKEDAGVQLLRYLKQYGKAANKEVVTKSVIASLCVLYEEKLPERYDLAHEVEVWVRRLEK